MTPTARPQDSLRTARKSPAAAPHPRGPAWPRGAHAGLRRPTAATTAGAAQEGGGEGERWRVSQKQLGQSLWICMLFMWDSARFGWNILMPPMKPQSKSIKSIVVICLRLFKNQNPMAMVTILSPGMDAWSVAAVAAARSTSTGRGYALCGDLGALGAVAWGADVKSDATAVILWSLYSV